MSHEVISFLSFVLTYEDNLLVNQQEQHLPVESQHHHRLNPEKRNDGKIRIYTEPAVIMSTLVCYREKRHRGRRPQDTKPK